MPSYVDAPCLSCAAICAKFTFPNLLTARIAGKSWRRAGPAVMGASAWMIHETCKGLSETHSLKNSSENVFSAGACRPARHRAASASSHSPDLMLVERLWNWPGQELTYLHCHVDLEQLTDRIESLRAQLNDEPSTVHKRLHTSRRTWTRKRKNYGSRRRPGLSAGPERRRKRSRRCPRAC